MWHSFLRRRWSSKEQSSLSKSDRGATRAGTEFTLISAVTLFPKGHSRTLQMRELIPREKEEVFKVKRKHLDLAGWRHDSRDVEAEV